MSCADLAPYDQGLLVVVESLGVILEVPFVHKAEVSKTVPLAASVADLATDLQRLLKVVDGALDLP